jgi:hypothetical protein
VDVRLCRIPYANLSPEEGIRTSLGLTNWNNISVQNTGQKDCYVHKVKGCNGSEWQLLSPVM